MYIQKLKPVKLFNFLKQEYGGCKLEPEGYEPASDGKDSAIVKFKMVRRKIARMYIAEFSDYKCVVADVISGNVDKVFNKSWAEYMVGALEETKTTKSSAEQYKKDYNTHCEQLKQERMQQIERECEQNLLK